MKVILAGSREFTRQSTMDAAVAVAQIDHGWEISEVVCGYARGADKLGLKWSEAHGVPALIMPAGWVDRDEGYNPAAGMIRNKRMALYADGLIALWNGVSPGTRNMIETMRKLGKPTIVRIVIDDL